MSIASRLVRAVLLSKSGLIGVLGAESVCVGSIPKGVKLPAVSIREVSCIDLRSVANSGSSLMKRARVQVSVSASSNADALRISGLTACGKGVHSGFFEGVRLNSLSSLGEGPDESDEQNGVFRKSRDFEVVFKVANV